MKNAARLAPLPPDEKSILFEYDPSRSGEVPLRLLDVYTGYLQTDGYSGYNAVCKKNDKSKKVSKSDRVPSHINQLYIIERQIKTLPIDEKYQQYPC